MKKRTVCVIMILLLISTIPVCGATALTKAQTDKYLYDISYYEQYNITNPSYGSVGGEWMVMGLARYGAVTRETLSTYKSNLKAYVKSCNGQLSSRKYTEYARVVIALTAIEENPENFAGYNLVRPLAEYDRLISQGLNGIIYGLIALDCGNYDIPKPEKNYTGEVTTREKLVKTILNNQKSDGGWNFSGTKADTDMTAMAIQALAPYMSEERVKKAVDKAVDCLGELQQSDGGYATSNVKNCESTAQVLTAISTINVSVKDSRFIKNGNSVIDGLMKYYKNGGFSHAQGGMINQMSTEQAMYALTAYYRNISGMNRLFDMSDGITYKSIEIKKADNSRENTESKNNKNNRSGNKNLKSSKTVKKINNTTTYYQEKTLPETTTIKKSKKKGKKTVENETIVETEIETKKDGETIVVTKIVEETTRNSSSEEKQKNNNGIIILLGAIVIVAAGTVIIIKKEKVAKSHR